MKNKILFLSFFLLSCFVLEAQNARIEWYRTSGGPTGYTTDDIYNCGAPTEEKFRVYYTHCTQVFPCVTGCGNNPFRFTIRLYRDATLIATEGFTSASYWSYTSFDNVMTIPGNYRAHITFEKRKNHCLGWETLWSGYTFNTIVAANSGAVPGFNINGNTVPTDGTPMDVCISNIRVNASSTICEPNYYLGVQECNRWWVRTYDYEWGLWFDGQAPDNINLQALSIMYSEPPYYTGDPARQNSILIDGTLADGQTRYYRVNVCTGIPSWQCKTALIKVSGGCFNSEEGPKDINQYIVWNEEEGLMESLNENITVHHEAEYVSEEVQDVDFVRPLEQIESNRLPARLEIAPNPFSDYTTVNLKGFNAESPITFELFNTVGQRVRLITTQETQFEVHRENLPAGIYFYRASSANNAISSGKIKIN